MDVGGAVLRRLEDHGVDEPDERDVGDAVVDLEIGRLLFLDVVVLLVLGESAPRAHERLGGAGELAELGEDVVARGDAELERVARREPQLVDRRGCSPGRRSRRGACRRRRRTASR